MLVLSLCKSPECSDYSVSDWFGMTISEQLKSNAEVKVKSSVCLLGKQQDVVPALPLDDWPFTKGKTLLISLTYLN